MTIYNHQADNPLYAMSDGESGDLKIWKKNMVIHDTECRN